MLGSDSTHPDSTFPDSDTLMDYALGFLSAAEAAQVEAALEHSPGARAELDAYLSGLSDLVMELPPEPLPAGSADRLMARLNAEFPAIQSAPPSVSTVVGSPLTDSTSDVAAGSPAPANSTLTRPRRSPLYPLFGAAAALLLVVALLPGLRGGTPDTLASYRAQPGAVASVVKSKDGQPVADVVRLKDGRAYVQMSATVALPGGRVYQAWKIVGKTPVSLGVFKGRGFVAKLPAGTVFAVTLEPEGGSPQPTTQPLFAQSI